jgi:hypothetical protein
MLGATTVARLIFIAARSPAAIMSRRHPPPA